VLVSPSPLWSVEESAERGLRLTFCSEPSERLAEGAKRLGKALRILNARTSKKGRPPAPLMEVV